MTEKKNTKEWRHKKTLINSAVYMTTVSSFLLDDNKLRALYITNLLGLLYSISSLKNMVNAWSGVDLTYSGQKVSVSDIISDYGSVLLDYALAIVKPTPSSIKKIKEDREILDGLSKKYCVSDSPDMMAAVLAKIIEKSFYLLSSFSTNATPFMDVIDAIQAVYSRSANDLNYITTQLVPRIEEAFKYSITGIFGGNGDILESTLKKGGLEFLQNAVREGVVTGITAASFCRAITPLLDVTTVISDDMVRRMSKYYGLYDFLSGSINRCISVIKSAVSSFMKGGTKQSLYLLGTVLQSIYDIISTVVKNFDIDKYYFYFRIVSSAIVLVDRALSDDVKSGSISVITGQDSVVRNIVMKSESKLDNYIEKDISGNDLNEVFSTFDAYEYARNIEKSLELTRMLHGLPPAILTDEVGKYISETKTNKDKLEGL